MDPSARPSSRYDRPGSRRRLGPGRLGFVVAAAVVAVALVVVPWSKLTSWYNTEKVKITGPAMPRPPAADGVPGASRNPQSVGTDPGLVHFDVELPHDAQVVSWLSDSAAGVESMSMSRPGNSFTFAIGRELKYHDAEPGPGSVADPAQTVDVAGVPGTLQHIRSTDSEGASQGWTLRWKVAGQLNAVARSSGANSAELLAFVQTIRMDSSRLCVVPFRLTSAPPGLRWTICDLRLLVTHGVDLLLASGAFAAESDGHRTDVDVELGPMNAADGQKNGKIAGHDAYWLGEAGSLQVPRYAGQLGLTVRVSTGSSDNALAKQIAGGLKVSPNRSHTETWPTRPL